MAGAMRKVIPIASIFRQPANDVFSETVGLLATFLSSGRAGSIDLPSRGLTPDDAAVIRDQLGFGEVNAVVKALGQTHIHETAYAGVWWLSHRDEDGTVVSEVIEVTDCPELLRSPREDFAASLRRLQNLQKP